MSPTPLANLIRELAAAAKERDQAFAAAAAAEPAGARSKAMSIAIGTRVLDLVTGQQGVVIDGKRENVIIPAAGNNRG